MQIAYNTKYSQLLCVVLLLCIVCSSAQTCNSNNSTSAEFLSNLKIVLKVLASPSNNFAIYFYGQSPDTVYGLLQCNGGATAEECISCSQKITDGILKYCGNATGGRDLLDKCSIRYENYSFIGNQDTNGIRIFYNVAKVTYKPDVFREAVLELFRNLSDKALQSPNRYSSGSTNNSTPCPIYSLLQCWRDLASVKDCQMCLTSAIRNLLSVTFRDNETFQGGVTDGVSCIARYETYPFFNSAPPPSPSSPQLLSSPPIQQPPLPSPTPSEKFPNKIGIVFGIVGGLSILLCLFTIQRKFKSALLRKENLDKEVDSTIGEELEIIFNLDNIKTATRNFHEDNKLGEGGFGSVYKGTMPNGIQITVKKLSVQSSQGKEQFLNEVKLVAKIQHRNLVKLLGCCAEGSERLLVYELLPNKSLDKILFHPQQSKNLDWPKRLKIILGVARGLLYLHEDSHLRIIHRDIKASNILLDEKMEAKISDFGLARLIRQDESHVETRLAGTFGYMALEYVMLGQLSCKADVYSFGVVILEIICGRKNTDNKLSPEFQSLIEWVWRSYEGGNILDVIDKAIIENFSSEHVLRCIHVGLLCTQVDTLVRPPMTNVYTMLSNSSITNIENPIKPTYVSVAQRDVPSHISTSIPRIASSTSPTSIAAHLIFPSINDVTVTDLDPR